MLKDFSTVIEIAHQYAKATGANICVLKEDGQEIYQEPENWLVCDACQRRLGHKSPKGCPKDQLLKKGNTSSSPEFMVCPSGRVFWQACVTGGEGFFTRLVASAEVSPQIFSRAGASGDSLPVLLEMDTSEQGRFKSLAHILKLSANTISRNLSPSVNQGKASALAFSQIEGFSLSSRLLCAIRAKEWEKVRFFLERIAKALWQQEKPDFSKRLALELLTGTRQSLGLPSNAEGVLFVYELDQVFSPSSLALWMDRTIKSWRAIELEEKRSSGEANLYGVILYLNENFHKHVSLSEVASHAGLSDSYFSRLFKAQIGMGFVEYLVSLRIREAKRLLSESHKGLLEIALLCGFLNQSYFTKSFKKHEGISPGQFRRALS